jgi:hypothetical protein
MKFAGSFLLHDLRRPHEPALPIPSRDFDTQADTIDAAILMLRQSSCFHD